MKINGRDFRKQADDSLVCAHRDLSVCDECREACADVVALYANCYHVPNVKIGSVVKVEAFNGQIVSGVVAGRFYDNAEQSDMMTFKDDNEYVYMVGMTLEVREGLVLPDAWVPFALLPCEVDA